MLIPVLACTATEAPDRRAPADTATGTPPGFDCEDPGRPEVSADTWEPTGDVPATGFGTFAQGPDGFPVYAGSHLAGLFVSDDHGDTWSEIRVLTTHTLADLAVPLDDAETVFRSAGGVLQRTRDGGDTWQDLPAGSLTDQVYALAIAQWDPARVYAVLRTGATWASSDGGDSFTEMGALTPFLEVVDSPFDNHEWRLVPDTEAGGRIVFSTGEAVYTSDDGMATWVPRLESPLGGHSLTRDPLDADHLFVGADDALLESTDGGESWTMDEEIPLVERSAWAEDASWLAVASDTSVWVSADAGASFTEHAIEWLQPGAMAIIGNRRLLLSWNDGIAVSDDRGVSWNDSSTGLNDLGMSVLTPHPRCPNRVYAGSRCTGGIFESIDHGTTWTHVDHYFHYVMSLHYAPSDPSQVWAVSDDGVLVSRDSGSTWEDAWVAYHFHGFAIHPEDPDDLLIGSVASGVWADETMRVYHSADGGATWESWSGGLAESEASAHTLLHWPGNPAVVLLGTYKGGDVAHPSGDGVGLYRSEDGGRNWELTSFPELNVAWIASSGEGAFATSDDGLYRSTDEGVTWTRLDGPEGLLLSVDFEAGVGLTLAQDGRAWRSDDDGDTWRDFDAGLATNANTNLAQIAIAPDGSMAWATVYDKGVYRIALE